MARVKCLHVRVWRVGRGGFLLLYCPYEKHWAVRDALRDLRELPFSFDRDGSRVIFNIRG